MANTNNTPPTIRTFVDDYLVANKAILTQNKGRTANNQYRSLAVALAQAMVQYYGGDKDFTIGTQPLEAQGVISKEVY